MIKEKIKKFYSGISRILNVYILGHNIDPIKDLIGDNYNKIIYLFIINFLFK